MGDDGETVLEVSRLDVAFEGQVVIDELSFAVKRGEILTIVGPNGAGKTVLLRTLLGVVPHKGAIRWSKGIRIGYVPQRLPYIRDMPMSVGDFFALKRDAGAEAPEMLRAVGLDPARVNDRLGDLSSGQFQRVLIAWALVGDPQVLLFDEPTTGIDVTGEETIYGLLARLHRERNLTMLIVTHDLSIVYEISSTVLCLSKQNVCYGPPLEVLTPENLQSIYGTRVKYYRHVQE